MEPEKTPTENVTAEKPLGVEAVKRFLFLTFRVVLKCVAAVLLIIYILVGLPAAKELYHKNVYRAQDINSLYTMLDDMAQQGDDPKVVTAWLKSRPLAETDKLVEIVTPRSALLGFNAFFELSRRQRELGRPEEALFWLELGRFRLTYDIIRCGAEPGTDNIFEPVFKRMHSPETDNLLLTHPEIQKKITQRVLDFDEKYPAHNDPAHVCKAVTTMLPAEEFNWEGYRRLLRQHKEESLKGPDKAQKPSTGKK